MEADLIQPGVVSNSGRIKDSRPGRKVSTATRPTAPVSLGDIFPNDAPSVTEESFTGEETGEQVYLNEGSQLYVDASSNNAGPEGGGGRRVIPPPPCHIPVLPNTDIYYTDGQTITVADVYNKQSVRPVGVEGVEITNFGSTQQSAEITYDDTENSFINNTFDDGIYQFIAGDQPDYYNHNEDEFENAEDDYANFPQIEPVQPPVQPPPRQDRPTPAPQPLRVCVTPQASGGTAPTGDRKALGQHVGMRVIMSGMDTTRLKESRGRLRPSIPSLSSPPAEPTSTSIQPPENLEQLSLSQKMKMFEAKSVNSRGVPAPKPMPRKSSGSASGSELSPSVNSRIENFDSPPPRHVQDLSNGQRCWPAGKSTTLPSGMGLNMGWDDQPQTNQGHARGGSTSEEGPGLLPPKMNNAFKAAPPPSALPPATSVTPPVRRTVESKMRSLPLPSYNWYWPNETRENCENALRRLNKEGAFIIRDNRKLDDSKPYTLSVYHEANVYNLLIRRKSNNKYALASEKQREQEFYSVPEMVSYHQAEPLLVVKRGQSSGSGQVLLKSYF